MTGSPNELAVFDCQLPSGTPLVYEIIGNDGLSLHRAIVCVGRPARYDVPRGTYQIRLAHPVLGRICRELVVSDATETTYFDDAEVALDPHESEAQNGPANVALGLCSLSWWRCVAGRGMAAFSRVRDEDIELDGSADERRLSSPLASLDSGIAVLQLSRANSIAVRLPPGMMHLELRTRRGQIRLRPRIDNLRAESMLEYAAAGYVDQAEFVRGQVPAEELLEPERQGPAVALIAAYHLISIGHAGLVLEPLRALHLGFPELADTAIVLAAALSEIGADRSDVRDLLVAASRTGVPLFRDGLRRLSAALDHCLATGNEPDAELIRAIERTRAHQRVLDHRGAYATWSAWGDSPAPSR